LANTRDRGPSEITGVISRKFHRNLDTWTSSTWRIMLAIGVVFVVYLVWRGRPLLRTLIARVPELRASLIGFAIVVVLGYALNDSGVAIPAVMLVVLIGVLVGLLMRADDQRTDETPELVAAPASTDSVLAATPSH
jgi:di/tricarboxylate transporter